MRDPQLYLACNHQSHRVVCWHSSVSYVLSERSCPSFMSLPRLYKGGSKNDCARGSNYATDVAQACLEAGGLPLKPIMVATSPGGAGLYHRPRCFDAVRWSQDNLIAAATGAQVTVFSPGSPQDSRSSTPAGLLTSPPEDVFSSAEAGPRYRCQQLSQSDKAGNKSYVRAVCWSPRGLQASGECYLTVVSSAGSVSGARPVHSKTLAGRELPGRADLYDRYSVWLGTEAAALSGP